MAIGAELVKSGMLKNIVEGVLSGEIYFRGVRKFGRGYTLVAGTVVIQSCLDDGGVIWVVVQFLG